MIRGFLRGQRFQSTLLQEERREIFTNLHIKKTISIHAPTRGATCSLDVLATYKDISIHAPTRGATAKMHNIPYASLQ